MMITHWDLARLRRLVWDGDNEIKDAGGEYVSLEKIEAVVTELIAARDTIETLTDDLNEMRTAFLDFQEDAYRQRRALEVELDALRDANLRREMGEAN